MVSKFLPSLLRCGLLTPVRPEINALCTLAGRLHISPSVITSEKPNCLTSFTNHRQTSYPSVIPTRNSTIFTSLTSDVIWEGVTGPKGSTKKRARGKRRVTRPKIDLNRGQKIGGNKEGYLWPGLNAPLYEQSFLRKVQKVSTGLNGF